MVCLTVVAAILKKLERNAPIEFSSTYIPTDSEIMERFKGTTHKFNIHRQSDNARTNN
jgi:hypothetical protein